MIHTGRAVGSSGVSVLPGVCSTRLPDAIGCVGEAVEREFGRSLSGCARAANDCLIQHQPRDGECHTQPEQPAGEAVSAFSCGCQYRVRSVPASRVRTQVGWPFLLGQPHTRATCPAFEQERRDKAGRGKCNQYRRRVVDTHEWLCLCGLALGQGRLNGGATVVLTLTRTSAAFVVLRIAGYPAEQGGIRVPISRGKHRRHIVSCRAYGFTFGRIPELQYVNGPSWFRDSRIPMRSRCQVQLCGLKSH